MPSINQLMQLINELLYSKSSGRIGDRKTSNPVWPFRKHSTGRALRSKSLLGRAPHGRAAKPLGARNLRSSTLSRVRQHSQTPLQRCFLRTFRSNSRLGRARQPLGALNLCSGVLRNNLALGAVARASFVGHDNTFVFPAKSLSKSLCFELCTVRCHLRI